MHMAARESFTRMINQIDALGGLEDVSRILDMGGANVNGTVHDLLPAGATIDVLDIEDGPGVTIVADARDYRADEPYDMVISTELLEHVDGWEKVVNTALFNLKPGGWFVGTAASLGRPEHGARGAAAPAAGEHYTNVIPGDLRRALQVRYRIPSGGFEMIAVGYLPVPGDVFWRARRAPRGD